jgi:hypothetical protein
LEYKSILRGNHFDIIENQATIHIAAPYPENIQNPFCT